MTKAEPRLAAATLLLVCCLMAAGCDSEVDIFSEPGEAESAQIIRESRSGPILVAFSSFPIRADAPSDGVRAAILRSIGRTPCSAASFYYSERQISVRWVREQIAERHRLGLQPQLILAGHGLGATEAAETTKEILAKYPDVQVLLLLTIDAVKTGRVGSAAVTGAAIVNKLPGVNVSFTAYDATLSPDGVRLLSHVNYYQEKSIYHGSAMAGAENHVIDDWTGLLTHANADDFVLPLITSDFKAALRRAMQ